MTRVRVCGARRDGCVSESIIQLSRLIARRRARRRVVSRYMFVLMTSIVRFGVLGVRALEVCA